jgi:hypothetical protein
MLLSDPIVEHKFGLSSPSIKPNTDLNKYEVKHKTYK